jgi:hypothetical protein
MFVIHHFQPISSIHSLLRSWRAFRSFRGTGWRSWPSIHQTRREDPSTFPSGSGITLSSVVQISTSRFEVLFLVVKESSNQHTITSPNVREAVGRKLPQRGIRVRTLRSRKKKLNFDRFMPAGQGC